MAPSKIP